MILKCVEYTWYIMNLLNLLNVYLNTIQWHIRFKYLLEDFLSKYRKEKNMKRILTPITIKYQWDATHSYVNNTKIIIIWNYIIEKLERFIKWYHKVAEEATNFKFLVASS